MPSASPSCASSSRSAGCSNGRQRRRRRRERRESSGRGCAASWSRWRPARSSRPPSPSSIAAREPDALPAAAPFLLLWTIAPVVAYWLSVPVGARVRPLSDRDRTVLRRTARKTWRYFETFVTEADAWLAPDNYQEAGDTPKLARRTSPTNIGMSLLSTLAAHDLGYLSTGVLLRRLNATLTTLESLERYQGHFLNWYDTATLAPLHPRYVSTVDSGNLAGALIALAQGLIQLEENPQTPAQRLAGLADTADLLAAASSSSDARSGPRQTVTEINRLARAIVAARARGAPEDARRGDSGARRAARQRRGGARTRGAVRSWERDHLLVPGRARGGGEVGGGGAGVRGLAAGARRVVSSALADAMRFDFLYDRRRRIFSIGYRLADAEGPGRLDGAFYDLLASEARLASFVAIAKGDVPQHHWFHLGRLVTNVDGRATLMSWGGTMFEYLMPQLLMRNFPGTLLDQSCRASVRRQIEYGRQRDVPWGISESAYAFTDRAGNYQYRAFGVPGLGLKRGLSTDLVIAPYATALASLVTPTVAAENFERLAALGAEGRFGFYEALDYNPRSRDVDTPPQAIARPAVVRAYFAHHQGMSLVALANVICSDVFVSRFHADPRVQATELLLQERVPREAILSEPRPAESTTAPPSLPVFASRRFRSPHTTSAHTHFLSNGRYTDGGHERRRRLQHVARPRGHPAARRPDVRRRRPLHLPARSLVESRLVRHLPAGLPGAGPVRGDLRSRQDHVPSPRYRHRDAARDHRVVGGRRGGAAPDDHQPRRADARDRGHQLRGDRAGSSRGRPRASGVRQAVRRDGVRFAERRPPVQPPAARGRRIADRRLPRARRRRAAPRRRRRVGDGPRALHRPRTLARQPDRPRRPRAVGHDGRGARPDRRAARAHPARTRRRRPRDVCHRCRAGSRRRAGAGAQVSRRQRRCARLLDGVHPRAHHAAAARDSATSTRCSSIASRRASSDRTRRASARPISPATRSVSRTCGATASPATCRSCCFASRTGSRCRSRASCSTRRSTGASKACAPTSSS